MVANGRRSLGQRLVYGIAQLLVIVLGVTLALAADAWRESMMERRLEQSFLDRLVADLESQLLEFEESRTQIGAVMAHGLAVLPIVRGDEPVGDAMGIIGSAYQASRSNATIELVDHTYEELLSTGGLGVITSQQIRSAVVDFYRRYEFGRPQALRQSHNAAYYNAVRGRIPVEIQARLRDTMNAQARMGCGMQDPPLQCALADETGTASSVAASLVHPEVALSLNLWMQSLVNELSIADLYTDQVEDVLVTIQQQR